MPRAKENELPEPSVNVDGSTEVAATPKEVYLRIYRKSDGQRRELVGEHARKVFNDEYKELGFVIQD